MSLFCHAAEFVLMLRWGWFQEGRFLGRVLDEWINDSQEFVRSKLPRLIVIAIIAFVLSRLLRLATSRMIHASDKSGAGLGRRAEVKTMAGVIEATGLAIIGVIALLQALDSMGFNLAPLLASAGVAGIAIGLAAQNIVKDMFNGMLFLVEDQFNVGDTVRLAGLTGGRGINDAAQDDGSRRRWNSLRHSQLADHYRGEFERRLLRGHGQCKRRLLRQPRRGDKTAQADRDGDQEQRRIQACDS